MKSILLSLVFGLVTIQSALCTLTLTAQKEGVEIVGDSDQLKFKLAYPNLLSADKKKVFKPTETTVTNNLVTLKYSNGGQLEITVDPAGTVTLKGSQMSTDIQFVQLNIFIDFNVTNGGQWQCGEARLQVFPAELPKNPHLYQGGAPTFTIRTADGKGITVTPPLYSYQELNDNRAWNWKIFNWMNLARYQESMTYKFEEASAANP